MANVAIDDTRFFGNVVPDQDYPELEDIAFSQNMLSDFASLRAARGRTIASQHDTTQQEDFDFNDISHSRQDVAESPLNRSRHSPASDRGELIDVGLIPGEESWTRGDKSRSAKSRLSEIEMMRGERSRASLSTLARSSLSSGGAGMGIRFDDDIPAFEDHNDEPPPLDFFDDMGNDINMDVDNALGEMGNNMNMDIDFDAPQEDFQMGGPGGGEDYNVPMGSPEVGTEGEREAEEKVPRAKAVRKAPRAKRQRVIVS